MTAKLARDLEEGHHLVYVEDVYNPAFRVLRMGRDKGVRWDRREDPPPVGVATRDVALMLYHWRLREWGPIFESRLSPVDIEIRNDPWERPYLAVVKVPRSIWNTQGVQGDQLLP
jgi:hypothetical protein